MLRYTIARIADEAVLGLLFVTYGPLVWLFGCTRGLPVRER